MLLSAIAGVLSRNPWGFHLGFHLGVFTKETNDRVYKWNIPNLLAQCLKLTTLFSRSK